MGIVCKALAPKCRPAVRRPARLIGWHHRHGRFLVPLTTADSARMKSRQANSVSENSMLSEKRDELQPDAACTTAAPSTSEHMFRIGGTTVGGVVLGGTIGSALGPIGTVAGAVVGGVVGFGVAASGTPELQAQ